MHMKEKRADIVNITVTAICIALLSVASYVVIPLPFTPVVLSMHTVAVNLVGLIMKPKNAAYTMIIYLVMGCIGLPVFSAGTGGAGKLFGPTGGFYFGFLFAVIAISLLKGKEIRLKRYILVTVAVGIPIQYLFGMMFMLLHNGGSLTAAAPLLTLIPTDIVKAVIASTAGVVLNKRLTGRKS